MCMLTQAAGFWISMRTPTETKVYFWSPDQVKVSFSSESGS